LHRAPRPHAASDRRLRATCHGPVIPPILERPLLSAVGACDGHAIAYGMATRRGVLTTLFGGMIAMAAKGARKQAGGAPQGDLPTGKYRTPPDARAQMTVLGRPGAVVHLGRIGA